MSCITQSLSGGFFGLGRFLKRVVDEIIIDGIDERRRAMLLKGLGSLIRLRPGRVCAGVCFRHDSRRHSSPWLSDNKGYLVGAYESAFLSHTEHPDLCPAARGSPPALREPEARDFHKGLYPRLLPHRVCPLPAPLLLFQREGIGHAVRGKGAMVPGMGHELLPRASTASASSSSSSPPSSRCSACSSRGRP